MFIMTMKIVADSNANGKKPGSTVVRLIDSGQGMDVGLLFRINYSIHQNILALNVIVGIIFNLAR